MRFSEIFVISLLTVGINCLASSKCEPEAAFCPENNQQGISYIRFVKSSQNKLIILLVNLLLSASVLQPEVLIIIIKMWLWSNNEQH